MMTLQQAFDLIAPRIPAARLVGDTNLPLRRVHTDSRSVAAGDLFVALKGERFDANAFLADAKASGAVAAIAHGGLAEADLSGIEVPDTTLALGALAAGWRAQFTLPVIAVTGSNGKTTCTQMIAAILEASLPGQTLATAGNFNNAIGVPLTLLRLRPEHRLAVVEMGMNHPGEIAYLADLVRPTVALVNNAQREHLEFMATVKAVAQENGAVISALPAHGVAVFPADDAHSPLWRKLAGARQTSEFALTNSALTDSALPKVAVHCDAPQWLGGAWGVQAHTPQGSVPFTLAIAGKHNVKNALAAVACALAVGVSLTDAARGLAAFAPVKGRSSAHARVWAGREITLIDDTYNANPDSVRAAIDVLAALPPPHLLVLGDMGEVGDKGPKFHAEVGRYACKRGIEHLICMGELTIHSVEAFNKAKGRKARPAIHRPDLDAAVLAALITLQHSGGSVESIVVKGSRFMRMERVIEGMRLRPSTKAGAPAC